MKTKTSALILLPFIVMGLSACSNKEQAGAPLPHFGNAVQQNINAQLVNPDAPESDAAPAYNGERAALAQKRYITNTSAKPDAATTTSSTSGGGGK